MTVWTGGVLAIVAALGGVGSSVGNVAGAISDAPRLPHAGQMVSTTPKSLGAFTANPIVGRCA